MHRNKPLITPETKVGELLTHYPELEELLLQFSPAFATLKNPILRRTVAPFEGARGRVRELIAALCPDVVVLVGLDAGAWAVRLETTARGPFRNKYMKSRITAATAAMIRMLLLLKGFLVCSFS